MLNFLYDCDVLPVDGNFVDMLQILLRSIFLRRWVDSFYNWLRGDFPLAQLRLESLSLSNVNTFRRWHARREVTEELLKIRKVAKSVPPVIKRKHTNGSVSLPRKAKPWVCCDIFFVVKGLSCLCLGSRIYLLISRNNMQTVRKSMG